MQKELAAYLETLDFVEVYSNGMRQKIFFKEEFSFNSVIQVIEMTDTEILTEDLFYALKEKVDIVIQKKKLTEPHKLTLVLSKDPKQARDITGNDSFTWVIDTINSILYIDSNKQQDFYGLRRRLDAFLLEPNGIDASAYRDVAPSEQRKPLHERGSKRVLYKSKIRLPYATTALIAINILMFLICTVTPNLLYNSMKMTPSLVYQGEVYRLFTAMFLHLDLYHIFSNMLMLYLLGEILEKKGGIVMLFVVYVISGVMGNFVSFIYSLCEQNNVSSIGASGAVYGVAGAILWLVLANKGKLAYFTTGRIIILIGFILYSGFVSSGVDNAAHVGGLVIGFIVCIPIYYIQKLIDKKRLAGREDIHED